MTDFPTALEAKQHLTKLYPKMEIDGGYGDQGHEIRVLGSLVKFLELRHRMKKPLIHRILRWIPTVWYVVDYRRDGSTWHVIYRWSNRQQRKIDLFAYPVTAC